MVGTALLHKFDYAAQPKEIPPCSQCGTVIRRQVLATQDRYGLPVRTVECMCGLRLLDPRMTKDAYAEFYEQHYRPLLTALLGAQYTIEHVRENQRKYALALADEIESWVVPYPSAQLLDLGGSTGLIAQEFMRRWGCEATVVDPCEAELQQATGCTQIHASAEDVTFAKESFDVILLCRTIEHLLDPKGVLTRAREWVTPDGFLVVDAMDVDYWGKEVRYKVDHPYAFTAATLRRMVTSAGWRVRGSWTRRKGQYVGLVCSPQE